MIEVKIINGRKYEFELTENLIVAREIAALDLKGYRIGHQTDGYETIFYFICKTHFTTEKKEIGRLYYNVDTSKFSLIKYINPEYHIHHKSNSLGVNGVIFSKLRMGDYIFFKIGKNKTYKIRVEKATRVGHYLMNTDKDGIYSELQFFIPLTELTEIPTKKKTTKRKRA